MAESTNKQMGDGADNYGQAAKQMGNAAKQMGKNTAKQAAVKGAQATGRAAAATVKAGIKTGKAVSQIAAGTAAGGPFGAIISAAWSMRHTLYKILICAGLVIVFIVIIIVSIPKIIFDNGDSSDSIQSVYADLSDSIYSAIDKGHQFALKEVERIIAEGGYDYDLSISSLEDQAKGKEHYDICYILAAYSASLEQNSSSKNQMINKLGSVEEKMFPVTYKEKTAERQKNQNPSETETIRYVACVINVFDEDVIATAFGIDLNAQYGNYNLTYGEYIEYMSYALSMTLFGTTEYKGR